MNASDSAPDGVSSAATEAVRLVETGKVSAEDLKELQTGKIYDALAAAKSVKVDQELISEKGVVISGKFIPTDLPEGVAAGDAVKVQVVISEENLSIRFLKTQAPEVSEESGAVFREILKALDLDGGKLEHLKLALESEDPEVLARQLAAEPSERDNLLRSIISNLSAEELLVGEEVLSNPEKLSSVIRHYEASFRSIKDENLEAQEAKLTKAIQESISPEIKEAVKALQEEITRILTKLPENQVKDGAREGAQVVPKTKIPAEGHSKEPQQTSPSKDAGSVERPVFKLVETLRSFSSEITERIKLTDTKVVKFVREQLEFLKGDSASIEKAVNAASAWSGTELLVETLKTIESRAVDSAGEAERVFKNFDGELRVKIEGLVQEAAGSVQTEGEKIPELKTVLADALKELSKLFGSERENQSGEIASQSSKDLPREFRNLMKSLEAQIETFKSLPAGRPTSEAQEIPDKVDKLLYLLKGAESPKVDLESVKAVLKEVVALPEREILNPFRELKELAAEILKEVEKPVGKDSRKAENLSKLVGKLEKKFEKGLRETASSGPENEAATPKADFSKLVSRAILLLKDLASKTEGLEKEIHQLPKQVEAGKLTGVSNKEKSTAGSSPVTRFIDALKSLSSEFTEIVKLSESKFVQFVRAQIESLKGSSPSIEMTMSATSTKGGIELLLETLRSAESKIDVSTAQAEKTFLEFVKGFQAKLETVGAAENTGSERTSVQEDAVKEVLKEGLRALVRLTVKPEGSAPEDAAKETPNSSEELPLRLVNLAKSIDSQVRTLLGLSGEKEVLLETSSSGSYSGQVGKLITILNRAETAKTDQVAEELKIVLKEIINFSEKEILRPVQELKDVAGKILKEFEGDPQPVERQKEALIVLAKKLDDAVRQNVPKDTSGAVDNEASLTSVENKLFTQEAAFKAAEKAVKLLREYILESNLPGRTAGAVPVEGSQGVSSAKELPKLEKDFSEFTKIFREKLEIFAKLTNELSNTQGGLPKNSSLEEILKEGLNELSKQFSPGVQLADTAPEKTVVRVPEEFPENLKKVVQALEREIKAQLRELKENESTTEVTRQPELPRPEKILSDLKVHLTEREAVPSTEHTTRAAVTRGEVDRLIETLRSFQTDNQTSVSEYEETVIQLGKTFGQKLEVASMPLTEAEPVENFIQSLPVIKEVLKEGLRELAKQLGVPEKSVETQAPPEITIRVSSDLSGKFADLVKSVEIQVKTLLNSFAEEHERSVPKQTSDASQSKEALFQAEQKRTSLPDLKEAAAMEKPVVRLIETLKSLSSEITEKFKLSETKVAQFVRDQLDSLTGSSGEIEKTLQTASTTGSTTLLLETLKAVEVKEEAYRAGPEGKFLEFTKSFRAKLEAMSVPLREDSLNENSPAVKEVLKEGLKEMARQFGLEVQKGDEVLLQEVSLQIPEGFSRELASSVKSIEAQIKTLLTLPAEQEVVSTSPEEYFARLEQLLEVLNGIKPEKSGNLSVSEKEFILYAKNLEEALKVKLGSGAPLLEMQELLGRAMRDLESLFSAERSLPEMVLPEPPDSLPEHLRPAFKKISSLLKELLDRFDAAEKQISSSPEQKLITELTLLCSSGKNTGETVDLSVDISKPEELGGIILKQAENIIKMLELTAQSELFPKKEEGQLLKILEEPIRAFKDAADNKLSGEDIIKLFERVLVELEKAVGLEQGREDGAPPTMEKLSPIFKKVLDLISKEMTDVLSEIDSLDPELQRRVIEYLSNNIITAPERLIPSSGNPETDQMLEKLVKLMGDYKHLFSEPGTAAEAQFTEFLHQFSSELEGPGLTSDAAKGDLLRRALESLQRRFDPVKTGTKSTNLLKETLKDLKNIENMVKGQEVLGKLSPVLRMIGEPAMLMFPTLVQGFLATLEVTFYPVSPPDEEAGKEKKGGGSKGYQKIKFQVNLPGPGRVQVDIAHRQEELLIHLLVRDEKVKGFMDGYVQKLRKSLGNLGYEKAEIQIQVGQPQNSRPQWVGEVTRRDSIIA